MADEPRDEYGNIDLSRMGIQNDPVPIKEEPPPRSATRPGYRPISSSGYSTKPAKSRYGTKEYWENKADMYEELGRARGTRSDKEFYKKHEERARIKAKYAD